MNAFNYLKQRQIQWAIRHQIALEGAAGSRGEKAYCPDRLQNLFVPLSAETQAEFEARDGDELANKMRAVYSSSAAGVNIFEYWRQNTLVGAVAKAWRITSANLTGLQFEVRLPIADDVDRKVFPKDPNLDVVLEYAAGGKLRATAVEVKFTEPYTNRAHSGIKRAYLENCPWFDDLPDLKKFAISICPDDGVCQHLHPAQLIKHVLGLKHAYGLGAFCLLYLWCDAPFGEGAQHRHEIELFAEAATADGVAFQSITLQEAVLNLARCVRAEHADYVDYVTERYL
jgi:hypothetical protein